MPGALRLFLRIVLLALAVGVFAAAFETPSDESLLRRNLLTDLGLAVVLATGVFARGRAADLPWPRSRAVTAVAIVGAALASTAPSIALPYLADDWHLLAEHGAWPTPIHALAPHGLETFFRPIAWALFWCFDAVSPVRGGFAHATNCALFAGCALLAVPALRRCGVPRGIAVAAALLFAVNPAGLETAVWVANAGSLLSGIFSLAALATLGRRRRVLPCVFALLAFLSKEDSFLLPVAAGLALARFRLRRIPKGMLRAWPLFAALAAAVVLRLIALGGVGGYRGGAGESILLTRMVEGPMLAMRKELPASYFVPFRLSTPEDNVLAGLLAAIPAVLIALGGISAAARAGVPRGLALAALGLAPAAAVLPILEDLGNGRQLFFPSVGLALTAAALLAGMPLPRLARWIPIGGFALLSLFVGRRNFEAWERSAEMLTYGQRAVAPFLAGLPLGSRPWVIGLPPTIAGVPCFLVGEAAALRRSVARPDLDLPSLDVAYGTFDVAVEFDETTGRARDALRDGDAIRLAKGESHSFSADGPLHAANVATFGRGEFFSGPVGGTILFPAVEVPPGSRIRVSAVGGFTPARPALPSPRLAILRAAGASHPIRVERTLLDSVATIELAPGESRFRIEVPVPEGALLVLQRVEIAAQ